MNRILGTLSTLGGAAAIAGAISEFCLFDGKWFVSLVSSLD